jgi:hypothetical protein
MSPIHQPFPHGPHVADSAGIVCTGTQVTVEMPGDVVLAQREMSRPSGTKNRNPDCCSDWSFRRNAMKALFICTAILGIAFAPAAAEAKGCIKGAIVGGVAGHLAGHGKVGAVAGCIIGRHEADKQDARKTDQKVPSTSQDNRI